MQPWSLRTLRAKRTFTLEVRDETAVARAVASIVEAVHGEGVGKQVEPPSRAWLRRAPGEISAEHTAANDAGSTLSGVATSPQLRPVWRRRWPGLVAGVPDSLDKRSTFTFRGVTSLCSQASLAFPPLRGAVDTTTAPVPVAG